MNWKEEKEIKGLVVQLLHACVIDCPYCRHKTLALPALYSNTEYNTCNVLCTGCGRWLKHSNAWVEDDRSTTFL